MRLLASGHSEASGFWPTAGGGFRLLVVSREGEEEVVRVSIAGVPKKIGRIDRIGFYIKRGHRSIN